jgi:hypothetical protein
MSLCLFQSFRPKPKLLFLGELLCTYPHSCSEWLLHFCFRCICDLSGWNVCIVPIRFSRLLVTLRADTTHDEESLWSSVRCESDVSFQFSCVGFLLGWYYILVSWDIYLPLLGFASGCNSLDFSLDSLDRECLGTRSWSLGLVQTF